MAKQTRAKDRQPPAEGRAAEAVSLVADVAWLHYVYGLNQAEIADRRGLSRMKVHRLLQQAQDGGMVRVFVDQVPSFCADLEAELIERFRLTSCSIAPDATPDSDMFTCMAGLANAAAMFLHASLESTDARIVGIGSGRTMAATVHALPAISRPRTTFVSLTGDFAVLNEANPFEVINTLIQKTGGKGHAFTAPLIVESKEDRDLFMRQRGVAGTMAIVAEAEFFFAGLGNLGRNSFFGNYGLATEAELAELATLDVAADLCGNLITTAGEFVTTGLAERMLGVSPASLRAHRLNIVVGGQEKAKALLAALRTGCIDGLVANEGLARTVLQKARSG